MIACLDRLTPVRDCPARMLLHLVNLACFQKRVTSLPSFLHITVRHCAAVSVALKLHCIQCFIIVT